MQTTAIVVSQKHLSLCRSNLALMSFVQMHNMPGVGQPCHGEPDQEMDADSSASRAVCHRRPYP